MEQKCPQRAERDTSLSGQELMGQWVRSIATDTVALFHETYPDFAHHVMESIARGSSAVERETAPVAAGLPSVRSPQANSRQKARQATPEVGVAPQRENSTRRGVELATQIFAEYGPTIRTLIRQHVTNVEEEDEVYQNLYLSLVCKTPPQPLVNVVAYLNVLIRNEIVDTVRRRKSQQEMISRYATSLVHEEIEGLPDDRLTQAEETQRIVNCVARLLPAREAKAVIERYVYGYSVTETALRMRVNSRTICQYLCVGLKRVREAISWRSRTTANGGL